MVQLEISNHDSASMGMSLFFLNHEYHLKTLNLQELVLPPVHPKSMENIDESIAVKMKRALELAQADLAAIQQHQKKYQITVKTLHLFISLMQRYGLICMIFELIIQVRSLILDMSNTQSNK